MKRKKAKRGRAGPRHTKSTPRPPRAPAKRRLGVVLVVNFVVFLMLLGVFEIGARVFFPRDLGAVFDDPDMFVRGRPFVHRHPERGFALVAGFDGPTCRVNSAGFRGSELPPDLDRRVRILALGESSTFGWRVGDSETWPAQLQEGLGRDGVTVINAGVPSYTSAQVRLYLQALLETLSPDIVLVCIGWNDALYACVDNWMPEILVRQQPARWRQILLRGSGLYRALVLAAARPAGAPEVANPAPLQYYAANLDRMIDLCEMRRVPILLVQSPTCVGLVPEGGMKIGPRTVSRDFFIGLLDQFAAVVDSLGSRRDVPVVHHRLGLAGGAPDSLFVDPAHPNVRGYRLMAGDVGRSLASLGVVAATAARER